MLDNAEDERDSAVRAMTSAHESLKWSEEYDGKILKERDQLREQVKVLREALERIDSKGSLLYKGNVVESNTQSLQEIAREALEKFK